MECVLMACIFIGFLHSASAHGPYTEYTDEMIRHDYEIAILIGMIALSFSSLSLICIFVGLICLCAKKCYRQPVPAAPGVSIVNAVPGVMQYGQPLTHDQTMMHNQPAMHGRQVMYGQRQ